MFYTPRLYCTLRRHALLAGCFCAPHQNSARDGLLGTSRDLRDRDYWVSEARTDLRRRRAGHLRTPGRWERHAKEKGEFILV
ncbi:hypothetical protein NDU88_004363 [Pleurodeles waltl]|uniref:Secreted protein n=1 Tax=Pleurodeles waltl TaxID=8319 RepID=A0AAV7TR43_PLEWA|nr:hypothetical protein NDU88_004363 [Pleurodeles waltl]